MTTVGGGAGGGLWHIFFEGTIYHGKVDVVADLFVATHQRHQLVDFSFPIMEFITIDLY